MGFSHAGDVTYDGPICLYSVTKLERTNWFSHRGVDLVFFFSENRNLYSWNTRVGNQKSMY